VRFANTLVAVIGMLQLLAGLAYLVTRKPFLGMIWLGAAAISTGQLLLATRGMQQ
jgi:drug/metabolite transporter (DMT)-like permease